MKIVLATSNKDKVKEIKAFLKGYEILGFDEVLEPFEIDETGSSFKENALIKARAVYEALDDKSYVVLADDSGICVPLLGGEPGIYSARYAGLPSDSKKNLQKLVKDLKALGVEQTPAFYTAAIAMVYRGFEYCTHGFMHGFATTNPKGENGFGYDSMFIPKNQSLTLGELDIEFKLEISHRTQALELVRVLLTTLKD